MGLPVRYFIAALNRNRVFLDYLENGKFVEKPAIKTISNAMDVGNPSNFTRITDIFRQRRADIKNKIKSFSTDDNQTRQAISEAEQVYDYILDPHGAVGYAAWKKNKRTDLSDTHTIVLETAHPAKFLDVMPVSLAQKIEMPPRLQAALDKQKKSTRIPAGFGEFKSVLLEGLK